MEKLTQQEQVRRQKMQDLIDMGIDPFGSRYDRTSNSGIIKSSYEDKTKEELDELQVTVKIAGRIMTKRRQGKAGFMNIQDREGQIQIYVRKDEIGDDQYEIFKKNDIGDIVGIEGTVMKTDHGQLSVRAKNYTHLSKSLRPLPEKFHGLTDVEERFRRRYVDLIMNPEAKHIALTRPKIIRAIQHYLDGQGLVEVETPVMQPILGGASARPFVTHHNTLNMDFYLRIATELPLKRLIVGGLEGVYEIGRLFRNEGMDAMHNPEFTTVEAYVAYSDLHGMMDLIEGLFDSVANEVLGTTDITYQGTQLSLKAPFKRIHMVDAIKEACGVDFWQDMSYEEAVKLAEEHDLPLVATNDVVFLAPDDFEAHEIRVAIHDGYTLDDPKRPKRYTEQQYFRSEEDMCDLFADIPSALENTVLIAQRCNVTLRLGQYFLPQFPTGGLSTEDYLVMKAKEGLEERLAFLFPDEKVRAERRPEYDERLQVELDVINQMGFPGYFLIVMEFIQWSKDNDIPVGPGRGSGAGSLVAYALKITDLDPLEFDLLFERFLNPERVSMPDFDVDFCMDGRDRVIDHVAETYGRGAVSQIITFGTDRKSVV